jgi:hypothetical protein
MEQLGVVPVNTIADTGSSAVLLDVALKEPQVSVVSASAMFTVMPVRGVLVGVLWLLTSAIVGAVLVVVSQIVAPPLAFVPSHAQNRKPYFMPGLRPL